MKIVIASGKGGTGKTTIATSLALAIHEQQSVSFLDCDVEAPNAHIYLQPNLQKRQPVEILIPEVDEECCSACGRCGEVCEYHAIVNLGNKVLVFPQLCHGCGSCRHICPEGAIREVASPLGYVESGLTPQGMRFARGILNIGEPMAVPVIRQLKKWGPVNGLTILDAPPGVSCPVVETMRGADFVLLVTEPTPFGLHDLKAAIQVVEELKIPYGVIVNRDGIGDGRMREYLVEEGIPVLTHIPMSRGIAEALARGENLVTAFPEYLPSLQQVYQEILSIQQVEAVI